MRHWVESGTFQPESVSLFIEGSDLYAALQLTSRWLSPYILWIAIDFFT